MQSNFIKSKDIANQFHLNDTTSDFHLATQQINIPELRVLIMKRLIRRNYISELVLCHKLGTNIYVFHNKSYVHLAMHIQTEVIEIQINRLYTVPAPFLSAFTIVLRHVFPMFSIQECAVFKSAQYCYFFLNLNLNNNSIFDRYAK